MSEGSVDIFQNVASILTELKLEHAILTIPIFGQYIVSSDGFKLETRRLETPPTNQVPKDLDFIATAMFSMAQMGKVMGVEIFPKPLDIDTFTLWRRNLTSYNPEALAKAAYIAKTYDVNTIVIKSDKEYSDDATLEKTISQKIYFVSNEDWEGTGKTTEHLIRYEKMRAKALSDIANAKRTEKASEFSAKLSEKIEEVKGTYRETHQGKEPPLSKIAEILTDQQIESPSGGSKWFAQTVKRVLERSSNER